MSLLFRKIPTILVLFFLFSLPACAGPLPGQAPPETVTKRAEPPAQVPGALTWLEVRDTAPGGMPRRSEPVTSGLPLPESAEIKDVNRLTLKDAEGKPVPAQFQVTSRWGGRPDDASRPIRWVLLDFQADVPKSGSAFFFVTPDKGPAVSQQTVSIIEKTDAVLVDTGVTRFEIRRDRFNLFERVWSTSGEGGERLVVEQSGKGGVVLVDAEGKRFSSLTETPEEVVIEEKGPLRSVIKIRGVLRAEDGAYFAPAVKDDPDWPRFSQPYPHSFVYYNCRVHFYAGKDYARVFFTLENNGSNGRTNPEQKFAPIQIVYFDSVSLEMNLAARPKTSVRTVGAAASLNQDQGLKIFQSWRETEGRTKNGTLEPSQEKGPFYHVTSGGKKKAEGEKHPGWLELGDEEDGILLNVRYFWQNHPTSISVQPDLLKISLWPEEGYYPHCRSEDFPHKKFDMYCREAGQDAGLYLFDAGRHKTTEMMIGFSVAPNGQSAADRQMSLEHPLVALAPAEWYSDSGALGMIAPAGLQVGDKTLDEALNRFERLQLALVDEKVSENGWSLPAIKTKNPPPSGFKHQDRFFGWMHFGDFLWSNQSPSALHYDWPYTMLLHYLRSGDRRFYDMGIPMARHRYDIDQYHGERKDRKRAHRWLNHHAFYESERHADPSIADHNMSKIAMNSHTWNGGLVLSYLLTGDRKAWEAAVGNGKAALNMYGGWANSKNCAQSELRQETWPILNLLNLYRVDGNPEYLRVARNIALNRVLYREKHLGSRGYFGRGKCKSVDMNQQESTMYAYAVDPIIQAHYEIQDEELGKMIVRMADFARSEFLSGGTFNEQGEYKPLQSTYIWKADKPGQGGEPEKNVFWADLFAYAHHLTGDESYLEWARRAFKDGMFYYATHGKFMDPGTRSRISFIDSMFPGSETKVHGWIGRTNQVYLFVERQTQQQDATGEEPPKSSQARKTIDSSY